VVKVKGRVEVEVEGKVEGGIGVKTHSFYVIMPPSIG
jgi:hypothetical protein